METKTCYDVTDGMSIQLYEVYVIVVSVLTTYTYQIMQRVNLISGF